MKYKVSLLFISVFLLIFFLGCSGGDSKELKNIIITDSIDTLIFNKSYFIQTNEVFEGRINGEDVVLELVNLKSNGEIKLSINNHVINFSDDCVAILDDIMFCSINFSFNDYAEGLESSVEFYLFKSKYNNFPDILIEKNIGTFLYKGSYRVDYNYSGVLLDEYVADYGSVKVHIIDAGDYVTDVFVKEWPLHFHVFDSGMGYIYLEKHMDSYFSWYSDDKIIYLSVENEYSYDELLQFLILYFKKYDSLLDVGYQCEDFFEIEEKSSYILNLSNTSYIIENFILSDSSSQVRLKVNGEFLDTMRQGETFLIGDKYFYVNALKIYDDNVSDFVEICY